jgi:hypothetical protein
MPCLKNVKLQIRDQALSGKCKIAGTIYTVTGAATSQFPRSESTGTSSPQADLKPALIAFTPLFCIKKYTKTYKTYSRATQQ